MSRTRTVGSSLLLACALLSGAPGAALAEKPLQLEGFVGWHVFSGDSPLGGSAATLADAALYGLRLGVEVIPRLSVEGELALIPTEVERASSDDTFVFGWRAQARYRLMATGPSLFGLAGLGALTSTSSDTGRIGTDTILTPYVGVGAELPVTATWGARLDARALLEEARDSADGAITFDAEATLGIYARFGGPAAAAKPVTPTEPPADADGDGVADKDDGCPETPEDKDGVADADGCPDLDDDGDGIPEPDDRCPTVAEPKNGIDDEDGCPDEDADGDGVLGSRDGCADQPEDRDGFQDEDGCPDPDNDGDGVLDAADRCPLEAETKNGYDDADGCADVVPEAVQKFTGKIEGITFKNNSSVILKPSFPVLDAAAQVLADNPTVKLEIQGHTDDKGKREKNVALSQARADSVKTYLVGKGIDAARLKAVGYGPDKPAVEGKTPAARAANRRVEFQLIAE